MKRTWLKTFYYLAQLIVCIVLLLDKWEPSLLPATYQNRVGVRTNLLYKQTRSRAAILPRPQSRPRVLSWRRLLFLLR
ncbi:MAG: hypothetical protein KF832_17850 [Caldilineaceae bacterium]|nr:hypothetical protein [Caldilineaceae bacterium]